MATGVSGMLRPMGEVDDLVGAARALVRDLVRDARTRLMAGAGVERIQRYYVVAALRLLEEAEARAILAAAGDREALDAIDQAIGYLEALQDELRREFPDGEPDS